MKKLIASQDSSSFLKQELLALDKSDRNKLLQDVGMTIDIPPEQGLAMKADLSIPWNKLRVIRRCLLHIYILYILLIHTVHTNKKYVHCRWLKSSGVSLASEGRQRDIAKQQVGENIHSESAPFSFSLQDGGEELRAAAHVFLPNLTQKVFQLLEENKQY